ncbi:type II toxin-antitoxin system RelE/ParE family toxin [Bradyrhizobium sp.]|uniref:type II toxin-antitoxin system RelE/ParE family toxin n=1 Tax=Bradyrhizobium sp. TaxID=376 RepID=UPI002730766F|nr:type II toxin-antitoxin system RelE/ParE family toxin [Bradyrhizobium sp.]MDP1866119.1 type II toxin-antitoxin system RelE/ParE family toxin [Bradyrhizobium sp.]MDP3078795.1 type II toxin-antitoxin system RelE/ParE family toxin [Bradyrhizobium sp.]
MAGYSFRVIWSPEALDDIDRLWEYYAGTAGRAIADKLLREVVRVVATIDDFPLAGRSRDEIRTGLRSLAASPHVVFYRLNDDRPEIVRVLDGRQDMEDIFSEG